MAYKILWYSIPALHDNSNGAAIHSKIMLEALVQRGIQVKVLNALVGDDIHGLEIFNSIGVQLKDTPDRKILQFTDNGVEYFIAKTKGHTEPSILMEDQNLIFDIYQQLIEKYQPDLIMGYSGDIFSTVLRNEARARNIPCIYVLHNGYHLNFGFISCNTVIAPSQACVKLYREKTGIEVQAVGQFIDPERVVSSQRLLPENKEKIKYVTMVHPNAVKGLAIFVKLHQVFAKKHPEIPFLVVENVGKGLQETLKQLHYIDGTPFIQEGQSNNAEQIQTAEHTNDPRLIYDVSRVVITPSLCFEAWCCVASEAVMNGIPVVATTSGGLPEAVNGGGILLPPPESTKKDNFCLPTDEEIAPWVEALERCLNEDWTQACKKASDEIDLERSIDRLLKVIEPLMQQGQKDKDVYAHSAYFSDLIMQKRRMINTQQKSQKDHQSAAAVGFTQVAVRAQPKPNSKSSKKNKSKSRKK